MALYYELPVYKVAYQALLEMQKTQVTLPKAYRYGPGVRMVDILIEIVVAISTANRKTDKTDIIDHMRDKVEEFKILSRVLCDLKCISTRRYAEFIEFAESMSKQLAAWHKSTLKQQHPSGKIDGVPEATATGRVQVNSIADTKTG